MTNTVLHWLAPYYGELVPRESFLKLSPQHQIDALANAVEPDDAERAALIRAWSPAEQSAILAALGRTMMEQPARRRIELWSVTRGDRTLRAVAVLTGGGIDLRLLEGDEFRRTTHCANSGLARLTAVKWKRRLMSAGWA